ncbi:unnamed protein product [Scytosiphon promiscuus]
MALSSFHHNLSIDNKRGIGDIDMFRVRFWEENRLWNLWTNFQGSGPGGNQRMPEKSRMNFVNGKFLHKTGKRTAGTRAHWP